METSRFVCARGYFRTSMLELNHSLSPTLYDSFARCLVFLQYNLFASNKGVCLYEYLPCWIVRYYRSPVFQKCFVWLRQFFIVNPTAFHICCTPEEVKFQQQMPKCWFTM